MNPGNNKVVLHVVTKDRSVSYMYAKDIQEINESRYNKVVLHVHQRQSVTIGDK